MRTGDNPLGLDRETMRQLGYRTVDFLVERLNGDGPALRRASPAEMRERLSGSISESPAPFEEVLAQLEHDVLPFASRNDHPGFFAFVPSSGTWPAALGDFIASALNIFAGSWMEAAGPSQVELEVVDCFRRWLGLPEGAGGVLVSGGSSANTTALTTAREALAGPMAPDLVVYVSDQAHSSLARTARMLGFTPGQVRVLPSDREFRLPAERLANAIHADLRAGRRPLFVSASGGSTNSGAVDPLSDLAAVCREHGVWLHVDAAYGGFAVLTERGREALAGVELADSVTLDPHKWLYQPFECGGLVVRDGALLRRAFEITPDYLRDAHARDDEVNFCDLGPQLTRSFRALKVWLSLRTFGVGAFRAAIDRTLDLADHARERIAAGDTLELAAPASLGIVCFRRRLPGADERALERAHAAMLTALESSGTGLVSTTRLHGRHALRMCVLNHTSRAEDVDAVLDVLEQAPLEGAAASPIGYERHPDVRRTWLRTGRNGTQAGVDPTLFANAPLLSLLSKDEAEQAARLAVERHEPAGVTIVEQWDTPRDFFVLLEGRAEVQADGETVASLGPGDFFGELAALDWGAGFGYPRLASVIATAPVRLLVFRDGSLNDLLAMAPALSDAIELAVRERLARQR
jgi:aromatic-L-amino-acid/L-tryptophan decarboxylase